MCNLSKKTLDFMMCPKCVTNTCFECYKNWKNCPMRCYYSMEKLSRKVVQMLKEIKAKCKNFKRGCPEELKLENYFDHLKICEFEMILCKEKDCDFECIRRNFPTQHKECPHQLLKCQYCQNMP